MSGMTTKTDLNWFEQVPKVELHLHLEGAIPYSALWELVQKYGGDSSIPDLDALKSRFEYRDFPHFIETWLWKNQFLREYEDFTFIAEAVARDLARQNIRYAEVFYSPPDFVRYGLKTQKLTEAIRMGLLRVQGVSIALVVDLVRDWGPEKAIITLAEAAEVRNLGVIGIGMGGSDLSYPAELFMTVYENARRHGFHTTAHTGEVGGAESMWDVIHHLRVERIGHGTHAEEDERLVDYLAKEQIPLEICPLSNVRTGIVKSIDEHPVRRYFERGLVVTINTDDPQMFGNTLADEYRLLEERLGFSRKEICTLILQGLCAAWLSEELKQELINTFYREPAWLKDVI
jgi:adenosine deaminase